MTEQWNSDKTCAITSFSANDPSFGMPAIRFYGSPEFVEEYDWIAGFTVVEKAQAEHDGRPARRFRLADEHGTRSVGRLVVAIDCQHDAGLEWTRLFETEQAMQTEVDAFMSGGWKKVPARVLVEGDVIRTAGRHESAEGRITSVEIVPADVRQDETGLAIHIDTLQNSFLDMDLDEEVWVKRS